jgi:two-component system, NtrC family, nitrogen regulation sensor histidine kinase NtrY
VRIPLATRVAAIAAVNVFLTAAATFAAWRLAVALDVDPSFRVWAFALVIALPIAIWLSGIAMRSVLRTTEALSDGLHAVRDSDYSLRIAAEEYDELGDLVSLYNEVADQSRMERNDVYQRELLLDAILQRSPIGVLLVNAADRVAYSNAAARDLFGRGARLDGRLFGEIEAQLVVELREALAEGGDAIFSTSAGDHQETFRLSRRVVHLNTQQHKLILLERLTPELRRQEVNVWKKAIRIMNHELNNSLAPVSSLVHSARLVQERPDQRHRLAEIYEGIEERLDYLRGFLEGYAQFARLPQPRKERVAWRPLLEDVRRFYPFRLEGEPPAEGVFDKGQIEQVLINLLKNAHESGSEASEVVVSVEPAAEGTKLRVMDRGRGMSEETMRQAMLPFYSTKAGGTGLGLALSGEIIDAHGGRMRLEAREGGGTVVTCWLASPR